MIFASDLDQTLIYSLRSMGSEHEERDLIPAETKDGKTLSYMAVRALYLLRELSERAMFVPVTTRTIAQYGRIHILQDLIKPKYAVTSNGGNLLIDGEPDRSWNRNICRQIESECAPSEQVQKLFQEIASPEWVIGERFCDEMFFAYVIDRKRMPIEAVKELATRLAKEGWETSIQGRKVYLVPRVVNKRDALLHLQELEGKEIRIASGDSLLDRCMLDIAAHAIAPRHGELYREHQADPIEQNYLFTNRSGILAAVEILESAAELLSGEKKAALQSGARG